jgi:hypothetical protein
LAQINHEPPTSSEDPLALLRRRSVEMGTRTPSAAPTERKAAHVHTSAIVRPPSKQTFGRSPLSQLFALAAAARPSADQRAFRTSASSPKRPPHTAPCAGG